MPLAHGGRNGHRSWPGVETGIGLVALLLGACSTLDPQVMSDRLAAVSPTSGGGSGTSQYAILEAPAVASSPDAPGQCQRGFYGELGPSIDAAAELRNQYLRAVKEQSALPATISALLIPLSAIGIYHGVSQSSESNTRNLTALGLGASAAYLYANTLTSKPRQGIYLAGADAIGCAVLASRPYLYPCEHLHDAQGTIADDYGPSVFFRIRQLRALSDGLALALARFDAAHVLSSRRLVPRQAAVGCVSLDCPASVRKNEPRTCEKSQQLVNADCRPGKVATTETIAPQEDAVRASASAAATLKRARSLLAKGDELRGKIMMAGPLLTKQLFEIQNRVSAEVLKTEPSVESVFQSAQSLRGMAFQFTGVSTLAPKTSSEPAGTSQGAVKGKAGDKGAGGPSDRELRAELEALKADMTRLRSAADQVEQAAAALEDELNVAAGLANQVASLAQCQINLPALTLHVEPDVDSVQLPPGGKFEFQVSGGTGPARATAVGSGGAAGGSVTARSDTGGVGGGFVYTLPTTASAGDTAAISIADGSGNLHRSIRIDVHDATAPVSQTASGFDADAVWADKVLLGTWFPKAQSVRDVEQQLKDCNTKIKAGKVPDNLLYPETLKAFESKGCP